MDEMCEKSPITDIPERELLGHNKETSSHDCSEGKDLEKLSVSDVLQKKFDKDDTEENSDCAVVINKFSDKNKSNIFILDDRGLENTRKINDCDTTPDEFVSEDKHFLDNEGLDESVMAEAYTKDRNTITDESRDNAYQYSGKVDEAHEKIFVYDLAVKTSFGENYESIFPDTVDEMYGKNTTEKKSDYNVVINRFPDENKSNILEGRGFGNMSKINDCDITPDEFVSEDKDFLDSEGLDESVMAEAYAKDRNTITDESRDNGVVDEEHEKTFAYDLSVKTSFGENDESILPDTMNEMYGNGSTTKKSKNRAKNKAKKYICEMCHKGYSRLRDLTTHIRSHTGERPFVCDICQKGFSRKTVLDNHMRIHSGEKPFLCDICEKGFTQKNHLMKHLVTHTRERSYVCELCQKSFMVKSHLDRHILVHQKPYSCDICLKRFSNTTGLNSHLRTHTGEKLEKKFTCDICQKAFSYKNILKSHIRSHTGEKFFCGVCHKGFSQKSDLTVHFRIHTGEKPFACSVCGKRFSRKYHLNEHSRVHTGIKPEMHYTCNLCQKQFPQRCKMKKHLRSHGIQVSYSELDNYMCKNY